MMYLYIIGDSAGHYKIGVTNNPQRRLHDLDGAHPVALVMYYVVECSYARDIELRVKRGFKAHRIKGEWFCCSLATLKGFIQIAFNDRAQGRPVISRYKASLKKPGKRPRVARKIPWQGRMWTEERWRLFVQLYESGVPMSAIMTEINALEGPWCAYDSMKRKIARFGLVRPSNVNKG